MVRELTPCEQDSRKITEMFLLYFFPLEIMSKWVSGTFSFFLVLFLTWCVFYYRCISHIAVGAECIIVP